MPTKDPYENIPDARDGLNKKERIILYCLKQAQEEFGQRGVPTITLYGRVVEHIDIDEREFQTILSRMVGLTRNSDGSMSYG
ncbi:MAG: hypothetical protein OXU66_07525 [Gammaproteobacteria bacterium]|nr:hypothetical protein [Gammaproteobacteria bacterium]MDD9895808.1 hypothetical protein [Gammaproteobacteria bacterium]MDD9958775.1 hypothetical protein [Gammaproteobacteria bacterium]